jgi:hypothetical protein
MDPRCVEQGRAWLSSALADIALLFDFGRLSTYLKSMRRDVKVLVAPVGV